MEFKSAVNAENLAKSIVGFANTHGGKLFIGVNDDRTICGIDRDDMQTWVMDTVIRRYIHPSIIPAYEEVNIDGRRVVAIEVPQGAYKPYVVRRSDREDIYIRFGDTTQLASREQIARLFESGGLISVEKLPVSHNCREDELDMRLIKDYFSNILGEEDVGDLEVLLYSRDLMVRPDERAPLVCTYAGQLLFGKKPRRWLPQAGIRLVIFGGEDKDSFPVLDGVLDQAFVGFRGRSDRKELQQPSLPGRLLHYMKLHAYKEQVTDMQRERHWDYPVDVIRELVVNAYAHRDWTKNADVEIGVYANRMEVISPGALPNGCTVEKVKAGLRVPRNSNMVNILRDYGFMEHLGTGIRRKVIPLMKEHNGTEPEFEATEDYFKVTLWQ